jgi:uncharacterized protein with HEPN domain
MRNRLVHGYDTIDAEIFWQVLSNDLGPLISALEEIQAREFP